MSKDFEQIGHKNIELLRFYIDRDIKSIDKKIGTSESVIAGYFIASLVDILVVLFFTDFMKEIINTYTDSSIVAVLLRILCIIALLGLFVLVAYIVRLFLRKRQEKLDVSGELEYKLDSAKQKKIDDFDNIACDGLLICKNYMQRFEDAKDDPKRNYEKEFYYYEVIHHLEKARRIFSEIYTNKKLYIASQDNKYKSELIDSYRVNNFIEFSSEILKFLQKNKEAVNKNTDLDMDIENLKSKMSEWEKIE